VIEIIQLIVSFVMLAIFMPILTGMAIMLWKEMHGDENWGLRMWARYMMKEVPRESEDDIVSLLKRNTLK